MAPTVVDFTILVPLVTHYAFYQQLLLRTSHYGIPIHVISRNIVIFISFISRYQKYTLSISLALSSCDQWHLTMIANDKMSGIPVMCPYNPGC